MKEHLSPEEALEQAITIHAIAKGFEEMSGTYGVEPNAESLQAADEHLDSILTIGPELAQMIMDHANLWAEITTLVGEKLVFSLREYSRSIISRPGGREFYRGMSTLDVDKKTAIAVLKRIFLMDHELNTLLESVPGLTELWYDAIYVAVQMEVFITRLENTQS